MDVDEKWAAIAAERRALADLLDGRTDAEWELPSLCSRWSVRDVAAHVALTPQSPSTAAIVWRGIRAGGNFDELNRTLAVEHATRSPAALVAELREMAESRRKPAVTTLDNLLFDVQVHVQDVAIPLGLLHAMPVAAAREGAERVWRMGWPFRARRKLRGLRLVATDTEWSAGAGVEVTGPIQALLLLLTGRVAAALPALGGAGVELLGQTGSSAR